MSNVTVACDVSRYLHAMSAAHKATKPAPPRSEEE
jgi:hypothetical protein